MRQRKIITHKTIFTLFGNLPTSTELQGFHYSQGKIVKFSLKKKNQNLMVRLVHVFKN